MATNTAGSKTQDETSNDTHTSETVTATVEVNDDAIMSTIKEYSAYASGAALIPLPGVDLASLIGVQLKMVHSIGKHYDVKLQDNAIKLAISSLMTSLPAGSLTAAGASLLKIVPGIGTFLGSLAAPAYYAASTYAVGKVFNAHFASGGTLLNFNAEEMKGYFAKAFAEKAK